MKTILRVPALLLFLWTCFIMPIEAEASGTESRTAEVSDSRLKFSARTLGGEVVTSSQLAGKPYIVNFFASWCPPCRRELPDMVLLQQKYRKQGFTFVGIAFHDNAANLQDFLWEQGIDYPVVLSDTVLAEEFRHFIPGGVRAIPVSFVVDRNGRVIRVLQGAQSRVVFEEMIRLAISSPAM